MGEQKTVLIVEDELIIAMDLEQSLEDLGWTVLGPASTAKKAFQLLEKKTPNVAILDFNVRGGTSEELALGLMERGVPVVFLSGDSTTTQIEGLKDCRVLAKPVKMDTIKDVLDEISR